MDDFFLKPFLDVLVAAGIRVTISDYQRITLALRGAGPWDLEDLRGVLSALLVKNPEQEKLFQQHFSSFFDATLRTDEAIEFPAFSQPATTPPTPVPVGTKTIVHDKANDSDVTALKVKPRARYMHRYKWLIGLGTVLLLVTSAAYIFISRSPDEPPTVIQDPTVATPSPTPTPPSPLVDLVPLAKLCLVVILIALAYSFFRWFFRTSSRRGFRTRAPLFDPTAPRHFDPGVIGGKLSPFLDSVTLDHLADLVGYGLSENLSGKLNLRASVEMTVRSGGLPTLIYHEQKRLKTIYIVEDALAEQLVWNFLPQELAEGLALRGVPVVYGKFYDSLESFETADGSTYWVDELEAEGFDDPMMVFGDGRSVGYRKAIGLEPLARRPTLAWMELREPRFWDENTALIASNGIPVYPATSEGTREALRRFQTEQNLPGNNPRENLTQHQIPVFSGEDLRFKLERMLGDALPWAQACAMTQPLSLGLADSLRRQFQSQLPSERISRLFVLPGTIYSNSALRFSDAVLAALRSGFVVRWDDEKQEEILTYILRKIGEVEPAQQNSLAHLSWQWVAARVQLELDPDRALEEIERLIETPLGDHIKAEIENVYVADSTRNRNVETTPVRIPVRQGAMGAFPWRRLALINEELGGKNRDRNKSVDNRWELIRPLALDPMMLQSHAIEEVIGTLRKPVADYVEWRNVDRRDSRPSATPLRDYAAKLLSIGRSTRVGREARFDRETVSGEAPGKHRLRGQKGVWAGMIAGMIAGIAASGLPDSSKEGLDWVIRNLTEPVGVLFIRLMLLMIVPLVFSSVVIGVAGIGYIRKLGRVGLKSLVYGFVLSAISVVIGLTLANTIRPGERIDPATKASLEQRYSSEATKQIDAARQPGGVSPLMQVVESIVPSNPIASVAGVSGNPSAATSVGTPNMLHLMFFGLFLGVAATLVPSRVSASVLRTMESVYEISSKVTDLVMKLAPLAFACLLFTNVARIELELLGALGWYIVTVLLGLTLHLFGVYSLSVYFLSRLSPLEFFRRIKLVMLTAFSTASSNATLPTALRVSEENLGVPREISRFVLTAGSIGNQNGTALFVCVAVVFLAQLGGVDVTLGQQLTIAYLAILGGFGFTGLPLGSIPFIIGVLIVLGVNPALVAIIFGVDRILDVCRTTLNVVGDMIVATFVARSEGYELNTTMPPASGVQRRL